MSAIDFSVLELQVVLSQMSLLHLSTRIGRLCFGQRSCGANRRGRRVIQRAEAFSQHCQTSDILGEIEQVQKMIQCLSDIMTITL